MSKKDYKASPCSDLVEFLKENKDQAFTIKELAEKLGISKAAVLGQMHRKPEKVDAKRIKKEVYCTYKNGDKTSQ